MSFSSQHVYYFSWNQKFSHNLHKCVFARKTLLAFGRLSQVLYVQSNCKQIFTSHAVYQLSIIAKNKKRLNSNAKCYIDNHNAFPPFWLFSFVPDRWKQETEQEQGERENRNKMESLIHSIFVLPKAIHLPEDITADDKT